MQRHRGLRFPVGDVRRADERCRGVAAMRGEDFAEARVERDDGPQPLLVEKWNREGKQAGFHHASAALASDLPPPRQGTTGKRMMQIRVDHPPAAGQGKVGEIAQGGRDEAEPALRGVGDQPTNDFQNQQHVQEAAQVIAGWGAATQSSSQPCRRPEPFWRSPL